MFRKYILTLAFLAPICAHANEIVTITAAVPGHILSAASGNPTLIFQGAAQLNEVTITNTGAAGQDVRFYDLAATPTCSSATGVVANYWVTATTGTFPAMTVNLPPGGKAFTKGIGVCITGANADNDNTNAVTGLNLNYSYTRSAQ